MRLHKGKGSISRFGRQIGILFLAVLLGLGTLNVGYSLWFDDLELVGTVNTGQWEEEHHGTAYAWGGSYATCFKDFEEINSNKWGWFNGELGAGTYEWGMYAGVGDCDPNEGRLVGTLTVEYDGATALVTYNMNEGYTMDATHLYVGNEPLPRKKNGNYTTAPGQYPYSHSLEDATEDSYTVTGLSGEDIYVVAHAVVYWFE